MNRAVYCVRSRAVWVSPQASSFRYDERQGLNVVRWNASWTDWRDEGSAKWQQTADGVWYPEFIEHSAIRPPCFRVPSKFKLVTKSFDPHPNFDAKQFEWRRSVPSGTKFEINDKSGKTISRGMVARAEVEKPEDLLNRLGDDAREGFPSPNKK